VTQNEINSFKSHIQTLQPVVWPDTGSMQSEYAQGHSGEAIKAMGLMYEITHDVAILDRMIYFCDVLLSQRNDILAAPYGQRMVWTNTIAPVWPGNNSGTASADAANGDCVGHLAYCARLILQTPAILATPAAGGDPYGHGSTYGARAATFVAEADHTVTQFFLPHMLNLANQNHYFYSAESPYQTGQNLPWNQQFMISYGLENLAACHQLLGDDAAKVAQYDGIVQANINWFFNTSSVRQIYTDPAGNTAYNWGYAPSGNGGEDSNHGALDVAGFCRAYVIGRYGITRAMMTPFANMFCDVMTLGSDNYAGRVDGTNGTGHAAPTTYIRSAYLLLAEFRPDKYAFMMGDTFTEGGTTGSVDAFSRFLWVKNQRYLASSNQVAAPTISPSGGTYTGAQSVTLATSTSGATIRYTTDGSTPSATVGTVFSSPISVAQSMTIKAIAYKTGWMDSPVATASFTINVSGDAKFTIGSGAVTASAYTSSYVPANTVDGDLGTRWAGNGNGVWIQYDLGASKTVSLVKLGWYLGSARTYTFDIQVCNPGTTWTTVIANRTSSGTTTALETYDFPDTNARYVRIVGHMSSKDAYTNVTETEVWGH
jgi:hypothetical protein